MEIKIGIMSCNTYMFKALTFDFINEVNRWFKIGGKKRYVPILMIKNVENTNEESYCLVTEPKILQEVSSFDCTTSLRNVKLKELPGIFYSYKKLIECINLSGIELKKKDTSLQKKIETHFCLSGKAVY